MPSLQVRDLLMSLILITIVSSYLATCSSTARTTPVSWRTMSIWLRESMRWKKKSTSIKSRSSCWDAEPKTWWATKKFIKVSSARTLSSWISPFLNTNKSLNRHRLKTRTLELEDHQETWLLSQMSRCHSRWTIWRWTVIRTQECIKTSKITKWKMVAWMTKINSSNRWTTSEKKTVTTCQLTSSRCRITRAIKNWMSRLCLSRTRRTPPRRWLLMDMLITMTKVRQPHLRLKKMQ